jgi:hypothetical protein
MYILHVIKCIYNIYKAPGSPGSLQQIMQMAAGPRYIASAETVQEKSLPTVLLFLRVCCGDHVTATEPLPINGREFRVVPL